MESKEGNMAREETMTIDEYTYLTTGPAGREG